MAQLMMDHNFNTAHITCDTNNLVIFNQIVHLSDSHQECRNYNCLNLKTSCPKFQYYGYETGMVYCWDKQAPGANLTSMTGKKILAL